MANYLFTLTITPVQSFISQARKTKDLFAGSKILSTLIKDTLKKCNRSDIIFPQNTQFTSNKFLLEINKSEEEIKEIGNNLEEFVRNQLYNIGLSTLCNEIRKINLEDSCSSKTTIDNEFVENYFKPQLCNFFQVFWVAVELEEDYKKSYKKLEQSLGAIKNLRTFEQLEQIGARKCSVCGDRNGLFYRKIKNKKPKYILDNAIAIKGTKDRKVHIRDNESLCGVCFTKRFYKNDGYPSTAKIALWDWLKKLNEEEIKKYESYFIDFDEALYFKENLSKEYLQKWEHFKSDNDLEEAKKFLKDIGTDEQKKYYALIHFDIDDMGKTLSDLNREEQEKLSKVLGEFSKKTKSIVDRGGRTIYAGGDDFLGFVNLEYLFKIIKLIQKAFEYKVKTLFPNLTFSMGIIISHYKEPLHIGLDKVRNIIHFAKEFDNGNKNGLAISVLKHSGEILQTRIENNQEKVENLSQIIKLVQEDFSDKFIINLELEFRNLVGDKDKLMVSKEMLEIELRRLIKSSLLDKNHKEKIDELNNSIKLFLEHRQMSNFFHLLEIVRFIKRGLK